MRLNQIKNIYKTLTNSGGVFSTINLLPIFIINIAKKKKTIFELQMDLNYFQ